MSKADSTIPPAWQEDELQNLIRKDSSIGYGIIQSGSYVQSGVPVIAIRDLPYPSARTAHRSARQIEAAYRRSRVSSGDILISVKGTTGRIGIVPDGFQGNISRDIARLRLRDEHDPSFWYQLLQAASAQELLQSAAVGTTRQELSIGVLKQLRFSFPSKPEQRRIAEVLGDASNHIKLLERMIAKKQAIKQGMMQQLLTGRVRLPGFTGQWRSCELGDVLTVRHGRNQKAVEASSGRYPILATSGQIGLATTPIYSRPSVLIGRKGTIDRPQFQDKPFWTVDTLFYTEIFPDADPRYLYYVFLTVDWRSMNEASGVPSLSSARIESVDVMLPELDEQCAIRMVLDEVDTEIAVLTDRLKKAQDIRQGMMQQLLTGRTRLPVGEALD